MKCILIFTGPIVTTALSNLNLCAGLGLGIKGAVHSILAEYGKDRRQPTDYWEVEANRTPLLTQPPISEMPALSKGDDTRDDWSRDLAGEVAAPHMTLFNQPPALDITDLIHVDYNAASHPVDIREGD